ncbi:MAG: hypothetical protein Q8P20_07595 [bacterium]|nr:hypothetical protein [bacterium]
MKKFIIPTLVIILLIAGFFVFTNVNSASAYFPNWDISGTYTWVVLDTYFHDLTLTQNPDGTFTGTGGYPAGNSPYTLPSQTPETISGYVDGDNITFTTTYAGPYNPGYSVTVYGTISSGTISGNSPWSWYMDDNDGIIGDDDKCLGTSVDELTSTKGLGTNRFMWDGLHWMTKQPKTKNEVPSTWASIEYTHGCSCEQILNTLVTKTGLSFDGHYKFGCSKSILEDWNRGTYYMGPTFIETVEIPANSETPSSSVATLGIGKDYFLKAYGTGMACNQPSCMITFDPEFSTSDGTNWVDGVAYPYDIYGTDLLDLKVDGEFVDWGLYNPIHEYQIPYVGTGNSLNLLVYDLAGSYFNDTGTFYVDIIEDMWINLW